MSNRQWQVGDVVRGYRQQQEVMLRVVEARPITLPDGGNAWLVKFDDGRHADQDSFEAMGWRLVQEGER